MRGKRKNTADGKTPPSKGRPGRKPKAAPTPTLYPVPVEAPPVSTAMVTYHQPEDGGRLLELARGALAVSAAGDEVVRLHDSDVPKTVLRCDVCHGSLKPPVSQCSLMRHIACSDCGAGECRHCADLAKTAVYVQSSYLDTLFSHLKVPCPYSKYGCASSVVYGEVAAHAAACACPECSFEGSQAEPMRHLTDKAGRHGWSATNIMYGTDVSFVINLKDQDGGAAFLFVAEEDGSVFLLALGEGTEGAYAAYLVVCVRSNASTWPVYSSSVALVGPRAEKRLELNNTVVASCSVPSELELEGRESDCVWVFRGCCMRRRRSICRYASARTRAYKSSA
ncbi:hypothetical protein ACQ4PT_037251 [Festuca glaucescens]